MPAKRDSMKQILAVSLLVCFACSVVVSAAAVLLKPQRLANAHVDRCEKILQAAGLLEAGQRLSAAEVFARFEQFEPRLADLEAGRLLSLLEAKDLGIDPATFDQRRAAKDPAMSKALGSAEDIASISRRARYSTVYLLRDGEAIQKAVIPVHGYGLWSILYGFVALEADMNTVSGITFFEHGETAGLGGEVDNPAWKAQWQGKRLYADGQAAPAAGAALKVALRVVKGKVSPDSPTAIHEIDGLSGATLTSRGVENLIAYWLGDEGFGPILSNLRRG